MTFVFISDLKKKVLFIKMFKSCNNVFSDSIEIFDWVPLSSEQWPGFISIPDINNNTAILKKIKTQYYFVPCGFCRLPYVWMYLAGRFCRGKILFIRRVWRYQSGNHNPSIKEEQTTQWPKEKVQKDKQRSKKHTHQT